MVTLLRRLIPSTLAGLVLTLAWATPARADEPKPGDAVAAPPDGSAPEAPKAEERSRAEKASTPVLHHAPIAIVKAHHALVLTADLESPELVRHALVVYRTAADPTLRVVEFLRTQGAAAYAAEIPSHVVLAPWLEYTIELELADGRVVSTFATREEPYRVSVPEDYMDLREQTLLSRLGGRRSVVTTRAEYVSFVPIGSSHPDRYWQVEGAYTFRPLRGVTEFSVKAGVLRGLTPRLDYDSSGIGRYGDTGTGMYYTAPVVRFRLMDLVHADVEGLSGVTQTGFELGLGGELLIGDVYGSKLAVGFETIHAFGTRLWSRVDIAATRGILVSPVIEATDFPYADRFGVRLELRLGFELGGGFQTEVRGGYQAREMTSGGPSGGLGLGYAF